MCTIVFIPTSDSGDDFILAHNRDESPKRLKAIAPSSRIINGKSVILPIDGSKKGSWIYTSDEETVYLFNGGFEKHKHKPPYNRSRGKIVLEVLDASSHDEFMNSVNLAGVESFTQIFISHNGKKAIKELVWDGQKKYLRTLEWKAFIRSSSTLYNKEIRWKKQLQLEAWMEENEPELLLEFMQNTSYEIPTILKHPLVETVSTTVVKRVAKKNTMEYFDYL